MTAYFLDRPQQVFHRARCKSWPPSSLSPCRCFLRKGRIPGRTSGAFSRRTPALRLSSSRDQARRSTFHFAVSCSSSSNSAESEAVFRERVQTCWCLCSFLFISTDDSGEERRKRKERWIFTPSVSFSKSIKFIASERKETRNVLQQCLYPFQLQTNFARSGTQRDETQREKRGREREKEGGSAPPRFLPDSVPILSAYYSRCRRIQAPRHYLLLLLLPFFFSLFRKKIFFENRKSLLFSAVFSVLD